MKWKENGMEWEWEWEWEWNGMENTWVFGTYCMTRKLKALHVFQNK